jgi:hypothetical protein
MGLTSEGVVSVLYAKADSLRMSSKHRQDRHTLNQKATSMASPTIIFQGPRHLKYFLDHFPTYAQGIEPYMVGHSTENLPVGPTREDFRSEPISIKDFFGELSSLSRYNSNIPGDRHSELVGTKEDNSAPKFDHFTAVRRLLAAAKKDLPEDDFKAGVKMLVEQFYADDIHHTMHRLQEISMGNRSVTPKRGRNSPPNQALDRQQIRRTQESLEEEQAEALEGLAYTYQAMDVDALNKS